MTPEDLLVGPRGRRTCWELRNVDDLTERAVHQALSRSVDDAMYWQEPHAADVELTDPSVRATLLPIAQVLCESPAAAWWPCPAALEDQYLVGFDGVPGPVLTGAPKRIADAFAATPGGAPVGVDWRTCSGAWWSAPITYPSVATTRALGEFGPARLWLVEDSMGWDAATAWQVTATTSPRVYEIATPADWIELVARYPRDVTDAKRGDWWRTTGRDGRWLMPDWPSVTTDYTAVHVSVLAYLMCAGVALDVDGYGDAATLLAGWDPDATFWLDDVIKFAGPPIRWQRDPDEWSWHRAD